jgi:DNA-binding NtrC family response regulator
VLELAHQMLRLAAMRVARVALEHLPREIRAARGAGAKVASIASTAARRRARGEPDDERAEVDRALARSGGNISVAARALGLTRHGLKKRMIRLGMRPPASRGSGSER